ncbi:hypothetical protein LSAT2_029095 [Lamellibrachia satsuma]|nr:hypothetical protein LSAT2_029095 [Lamellibrachia satsuma]
MKTHIAQDRRQAMENNLYHNRRHFSNTTGGTVTIHHTTRRRPQDIEEDHFIMNALKLTVYMLVVFVALATIIDAFESDEETLSVETRDAGRRPQSRRPNQWRHRQNDHRRRRPRPRPRDCLKRCSKRCTYGSCTCRVTRNWYEKSRRRCEVCCYCMCDRRGFAKCYEDFKRGSRC